MENRERKQKFRISNLVLRICYIGFNGPVILASETNPESMVPIR